MKKKNIAVNYRKMNNIRIYEIIGLMPRQLPAYSYGRVNYYIKGKQLLLIPVHALLPEKKAVQKIIKQTKSKDF
jgi:hypothetical protein